jgi:ribosomal protein S18 acetylase RimI-like enzyme
VTDDEVAVHALTAERWQDLVSLFGPSGAYGNCWCAWWRQPGRAFGEGSRNRGAGNRALLKSLTDAGTTPGLLAYRNGEPVGWASVAPRPEYGRILRSTMLGPGGAASEAGRVWSVVCFWIPRSQRRRGVGRRLLDAAVVAARDGGAETLEAYPIDTGGERRPSAELFTGTLAMFLAAGFHEVERRRPRRPIVQLDLRSSTIA